MKNFYPLGKRAVRAALFTLLLVTAGVTKVYAQPQGAINGLFTINENGDQVLFSQGNLQYQASTNTWRFAEHQWDYVGEDNANISETYDGWIDLFGWGTSGWNSGANCYQPWSTSIVSDYYLGNSLTGDYANADWGIYNAISNGGNQTGQWRTLTKEEWYYVFYRRSTSSGVLYAKAYANGVPGVILFPDNWSDSYYLPDDANESNSLFNSNTFALDELEQHGAVFLPVAGCRQGTLISDVGSYGYYWSASNFSSHSADAVYFTNSYLSTESYPYHDTGNSVRLVRPAQNGFFGINATPSPSGGGTVDGDGTYQEGTVCTLTATPAAGFIFVNWTENGEVVSTNVQYTFMVSDHRWLLANFSNPSIITFADANVKTLCVANWDSNGDGELSYAEAAAVTNLGEVFKANNNITSFDELQYFTGLMSISSYAFSGCSGLTSITLPKSLKAIGYGAFSGCSGLITVNFTGTITQWCGIQFISGSNPLYYARRFCVNNEVVKDLVVPNGVTSIGDWAFYHYQYLSSVSLPNTLTSIGNYAFSDCSGLTGDLTLPNTLTSIGNYAFSGCSGLTGNLTMSNEVTSIGNYAFWCCSGMKGNLVLPNTLTSIGINAFCRCNSLTGELTLPNSLTSIEKGAFYNCTGFTGELTLPNSLTIIGEEAFGGCSFTGSLVLPNTLTSIGYYAFSYCDFTSVFLGTNLSQIEESFRYCTNLEEVYFNATNCIGYNYFTDCYKLHTLTLGEDVLALSDNAFSSCTNLQTIRSLPVVPPIINNNVFPSEITNTVALYVPCESQAAYQADPIWGAFTNYQNAAYELIALPENEEQGSVSILKAGDCDDPTSTVKADPNLHYGFSCWTKNGEVVSTDRVYTFDLEENTKLIAQFVANDSVSLHWVPNDQNYFSNMYVTVVVQIDGEEQASSNLELGAFCGDECRGNVLPEYFSNSGRFIYPLMMFGNNGDVMTFKLYDHAQQIELPVSCETELTYNSEDMSSNPYNPFVVSFASKVNIFADITPYGSGTVTGTGDYYPGQTATLVATPNEGFAFNSWMENGVVVSTDLEYSFTVEGARYLTAHFDYVQTTTFAEGWNWWSSYIDLPGEEGMVQLENSLGTSGDIIKSRNDSYIQYSPQLSVWIGELEEISVEQCYMVRTTSSCQATMVGPVADPSNHPITINSGWNWIGYPCSQVTSVETALSGFNPEELDVIKGRYSAASCIIGDNGLEWFGALKSLVPGMGYMYQSNSTDTKTLTFVSGRGESSEANITTENNVFHPADGNYADNMVVMAVLELDGEELRGEQYELAAFVGDECRGSVKLMYVDAIDRYVAFLVAFGEQDDELVFRVNDGLETAIAAERTSFTVEGVMGSLKEPCVLHFKGTGVSDQAAQAVSVYPNPSNGVFVVEGENIRYVEVFNAFGQRVFAHEADSNNLKVDLSHCANGVFMIQVKTSDGVSHYTVVKQ